jgi:hypothetical protein
MGHCRTHAPQQQTGALFDHFVGQIKQQRRNGNADRLSGFKIDDELEFCRLLYWNFTRLHSRAATDHQTVWPV